MATAPAATPATSVLLVDIGNTRVKWARLVGGRLGEQHAEPFAGWTARDFASAVFGARSANGASRGRVSTRRVEPKRDVVERIIVSSVAGSRVDRLFAQAARQARGPKPEFVASQRRAGGISTSYVEPWRLGVDRFVMAIGAHRLAQGRAVCIVSIGTALTIDLVDARGRHRGGAILPAPPLMIDSLLTKTDGIRRRAASNVIAGRSSASGLDSASVIHVRRGSRSIFARTTQEAIEQGALLAAAAAVDRAIDEARRTMGHTPVVLLTGGGAKAVAPLIQRPYWAVPDLVLQGLAVLAKNGGPRSRDS
jgi:type III pantothenate kinase